MRQSQDTSHNAIGTTVGATLSLMLIVAFGISSIMAERKETHEYVSQPNNSVVAVKAYLA